MKRPERVPIESLILNWDIYPRHEINSQNVADLVDAEKAGIQLPPVIADRQTKFVIDGFHRIEKNKRLKLPNIDVEWHDYADLAEMVEDAARRNLHGRPLAHYDKARCIMLAEKVGLSVDRLALALGLTVERLEDLRLRKTAIDPDGAIMPIKRTLQSFAGKRLQSRQVDGNRQATGMSPIVYVNQVSNCLENGLIDRDDERLMTALKRLHDLLKKEFSRQKVS